MIFFRVHTARINYQRGDERFLLFGKIKAVFAAPVDELSGMTVNLKDVDVWMAEAIQKAPAFRHQEELLRYYFNTLKESSSAFKMLNIKLGSTTISFDGKVFSRTYVAKTWFLQSQTWVQLPIQIQCKRSLSRSFCLLLRQKKWSSPDTFSKLLKMYLPELQCLEVVHPDWKGSQKFYF